MPYFTLIAVSVCFECSDCRCRIGRTLEALRDCKADGHDRCRDNEDIIFPWAMDNEDSAVQSQYDRRGSDDCERDGHTEDSRWISMS
jgi:hypothetical protein